MHDKTAPAGAVFIGTAQRKTTVNQASRSFSGSASARFFYLAPLFFGFALKSHVRANHPASIFKCLICFAKHLRDAFY
jgi:nicotinamide mononucleotide (NMN) deamidase PncC